MTATHAHPCSTCGQIVPCIVTSGPCLTPPTTDMTCPTCVRDVVMPRIEAAEAARAATATPKEAAHA